MVMDNIMVIYLDGNRYGRIRAEVKRMANGVESAEKKNRRRTAYFKVSESELDTKVGIEIRAWDKDGVFVGRLLNQPRWPRSIYGIEGEKICSQPELGKSFRAGWREKKSN